MLFLLQPPPHLRALTYPAGYGDLLLRVAMANAQKFTIPYYAQPVLVLRRTAVDQSANRAATATTSSAFRKNAEAHSGSNCDPMPFRM